MGLWVTGMVYGVGRQEGGKVGRKMRWAGRKEGRCRCWKVGTVRQRETAVVGPAGHTFQQET